MLNALQYLTQMMAEARKSQTLDHIRMKLRQQDDIFNFVNDSIASDRRQFGATKSCDHSDHSKFWIIFVLKCCQH